jgi:drug/metabolite transporter (DMT)-like permease
LFATVLFFNTLPASLVSSLFVSKYSSSNEVHLNIDFKKVTKIAQKENNKMTGLIQQRTHSSHRFESTGIIKGLFAVILFAMTVPMTKLALPLFGPELIAASRAFIAGLLALVVININRWSLPDMKSLAWLYIAGLGVVVGFPYLLSYSLVNLSAANMGVVLAGLPIMTSIFATILMKERYGLRFWLSSSIGAMLLAVYFISGSQSSGWNFQTASILIAVLALGGLGYSAGAKVAKTIGGWQTICWMLVLYLPFSSIAFGYYASNETLLSSLSHVSSGEINSYSLVVSIVSLIYLAVISQWWGFRFWYQAMAEAGAGRISQIQLLQPFFTLLFAGVILAEPVEASHFVFALLILLSIYTALRAKNK